MLKNRIIPCLDVKNGRVVKGINFVDLKDAGDPVEQAKIYSDGGADEICFLDITASNENRDTIYDVVKKTSKKCFVPLTVGGGVRSVDDINKLLNCGADKVSINTAAVENSKVVSDSSKKSLLFSGKISQLGYVLSFAVSLAGLAQFIWLAFHCKKHGFILKIRLPRRNQKVRVLLNRIAPVILGSSLYQVNLLIGTILATFAAGLKNLPRTGIDARPARSFIKFLRPGFGGPPFCNPTLPPSFMCSCPARPPCAFGFLFLGGLKVFI